MELKGKIVVVAGASGGIGRELSLELAKNGSLVLLIGRRKPVLAALKKKIHDSGGKARVFVVDLTDLKSVDQLAVKIKEEFGVVDILVNAAGIGIYKKFEDLDFESWKKSFAVNVDATFLLTQKLLPFLKKSKEAYVINLGSGMGKIPVAQRSAYCASKFALRGFSLTLSKEYKRPILIFRF
jgi:3-oxoacyl-[acyl-carrier protein] reductase